ncbi:MAG: protein translocase SEC61 complex subunit gamma [Thermoplasmata archaeon]|nr:MAG: protein translocase SEC61 complex subunit gamma [Thermoplasmata archaeon]
MKAIDIKEVLREWNRVIKLSKKPKKNEFMTIAKITGLGMILIGIIGFLIRLIVQIIALLS